MDGRSGVSGVLKSQQDHNFGMWTKQQSLRAQILLIRVANKGSFSLEKEGWNAVVQLSCLWNQLLINKRGRFLFETF